jgi:hypothetical protein
LDSENDSEYNQDESDEEVWDDEENVQIIRKRLRK